MRLAVPIRPFAIACLGLAVLMSACGGGGSNKTLTNAGELAKTAPSGSSATPTSGFATPSGRPTGTVTDAQIKEFGPPPVLGGNITDIAPHWAQSVKQSATRTVNKGNPSGICADVNFNPPVTDLRWFRMAVDGVEVTTKLILIGHDTSQTNTPTVSTASICYSPTEGLAVGQHNAAISVQNPDSTNDQNGRPIQTIAWKFQVVP